MLKLCLPLIFISAALAANPWTVDVFPNPHTNPADCKTDAAGHVCDPDGILTTYTINNQTRPGHQVIEGAISSIRGGTKCPCGDKCPAYGSHGYEISVAVMNSISIKPEDKGKETEAMKNFTEDLRKKWNTALSQCGEDILILLSVEQKQVFTARGKAADEKLEAKTVQTLMCNAEKKFATKDHTAGLLYMVQSFGRILKGEEVLLDACETAEDKHWYSPLPLWAVILIGVAIVVILLLIIAAVVLLCLRKSEGYTPGQRN